DPIIPGWMSPDQIWTEYGLPYDALRPKWNDGTIATRQVPVPRKWCQNKTLTYSRTKDVRHYAAERELPSNLDRPCNFLNALLANGPVRYREIKKQARPKGISERSLRRAKKKLGIEDSQPGLQAPSYWYFPEDKDKLPKCTVPPEKRPLRTKALKLLV